MILKMIVQEKKHIEDMLSQYIEEIENLLQGKISEKIVGEKHCKLEVLKND